MEDVRKKAIDKVNEYHKQAGIFYTLCACLFVFGLAALVSALVTGAAIGNNFFKTEKGINFIGGVFALAMLALMVYLFGRFLKKRAQKETRRLRPYCTRLKLVSQSQFDFLSLFISPDKVTFLRGSDYDDDKFVLIIIMQDGTIKSCDKIGKEEAEAMFEPIYN